MLNHKWLSILIVFVNYAAFADTCPKPNDTSLKFGRVPPPWLLSPGSEELQPIEDASFIEAGILVAGYTVGVVCTYQFSQGTYSIYQQTRLRKPGMNDLYWFEKPGGYGCRRSIEDCQFYP